MRIIIVMRAKGQRDELGGQSGKTPTRIVRGTGD